MLRFFSLLVTQQTVHICEMTHRLLNIPFLFDFTFREFLEDIQIYRIWCDFFRILIYSKEEFMCSLVFAMCMDALLEKVSLVKVALCTWYQQSPFFGIAYLCYRERNFPLQGV